MDDPLCIDIHVHKKYCMHLCVLCSSFTFMLVFVLFSNEQADKDVPLLDNGFLAQVYCMMYLTKMINLGSVSTLGCS